VIAGRDEDLLPGDLVAAVACGSALVRSRPRSVPQCGSVRFIVPVHSPDDHLRSKLVEHVRQRCFALPFACEAFRQFD
jgi:hypothetical protein